MRGGWWGHTKAAAPEGATPEGVMDAIRAAAEMRAGGAFEHSVLALQEITRASNS